MLKIFDRIKNTHTSMASYQDQTGSATSLSNVVLYHPAHNTQQDIIAAANHPHRDNNTNPIAGPRIGEHNLKNDFASILDDGGDQSRINQQSKQGIGDNYVLFFVLSMFLLACLLLVVIIVNPSCLFVPLGKCAAGLALAP